MKTLEEFVKENGLYLSATPAKENPTFQDSDEMDHWKVTVYHKRAAFETYFSMGIGHRHKGYKDIMVPTPPTILDVLSCLASDANGSDQDFESWASDLGYDPDSRKAYKTRQAIEKQAAQLKGFLGPELFQELVYEVEPD